MNKFDWQWFESWATRKAILFGLTDEWVDFVCWIVSRRVKEERRESSPLDRV